MHKLYHWFLSLKTSAYITFIQIHRIVAYILHTVYLYNSSYNMYLSNSTLFDQLMPFYTRRLSLNQNYSEMLFAINRIEIQPNGKSKFHSPSGDAAIAAIVLKTKEGFALIYKESLQRGFTMFAGFHSERCALVPHSVFGTQVRFSERRRPKASVA